ncbi:hypothetical protein BGZ72_003074 [Mortierella alpina]|nr:hypothetical protein BGZ72_003074 [Mortierella alpina]
MTRAARKPRTANPASPAAKKASRGLKVQEPPAHELSEEEVFVNALDAWNYVYINSFLTMKDPIRQLRIEQKELEEQWNRLNRGKDTAFGRDHDYEYLEKQHIFEYGLDEYFMERYNLSVMAHYLFMPELELQLLENGLVGYVRLFRASLEDDAASSSDNEGSFWRTFMQLIMLVMGLRKRQYNSSDLDPREIMENAWIVEGAKYNESMPDSSRISQDAVNTMVQVATQAAEDDNRLYGLYQNTMKQLVQHLQDRVHQLQFPADEELINNLLERRIEKTEKLYSAYAASGSDHALLEDLDEGWFENAEPVLKEEYLSQSPERRSSSPLFDNVDWMVKEYVTQDFGRVPDVAENDGEQESNEDLPVEIQETHPSEDVEVNATKGQPSVTKNNGNVKGRGKGKGKSKSEPDQAAAIQEASTASDQDHYMEADLQHDVATASGQDHPSVLDHQQDTPNSTGSRQSLKRGASTAAATTAAKRLEERVNQAIGIAKATDGSEFGGDSDEEFIPPVPKKKRRDDAQEQTAGGSKPVVEIQRRRASHTPPPTEPAAGATQRKPAETKTRKKNRPWSTQEQERLLELVPKFKHSASDKSARKRTVKWSKLKEYDRTHGDVLHYRDQVMLKDKYRDLTDNGQHRQHVSELNKAKMKSTPQHQFPQTGPQL